MKKIGAIIVAILMLFTASCGKSYEAAEAAAEKYIYEAYGKEGNIVETEFYYSHEGIMGGYRQYSFTFLRSDGVTEKYWYNSFSDITDTEITEHNFKLVE